MFEKWRHDASGETTVGPDVEEPQSYTERLENPQFRFSPQNFGDLRQQQDLREWEEEEEEKRQTEETAEAKESSETKGEDTSKTKEA